MISQSILPLRFATFMGLIVSFIMLLAIVGYSVTKMLFGVSWPPGFATTTVLLLLSISLNALFLGVIGEYLARIYRIMTKSHDVIIESRINMD